MNFTMTVEKKNDQHGFTASYKYSPLILHLLSLEYFHLLTTRVGCGLWVGQKQQVCQQKIII